jgi:hypothetical protein
MSFSQLPGEYTAFIIELEGGAGVNCAEARSLSCCKISLKTYVLRSFKSAHCFRIVGLALLDRAGQQSLDNFRALNTFTSILLTLLLRP